MSMHMGCSMEFVEDKNMRCVVCRHGLAFKVHLIWYMYLHFEQLFLGQS
jgi:hypothetical protein